MRGAARLPGLLLALLLAACGASPAGRACAGLDFTGSANVRGIVTYGGMPVAGALLGLGAGSAMTSSDGSFSIVGTTAGPQSLSLAPVRAGLVTGDISVLTGDNVLRIPVARPGSQGLLTGRAIDGCTGRPLAGVLVSVGSRSATSDTDGLYEIDGLCCGTLPPLRATHAGYRTYSAALGRVDHASRWFDVVIIRQGGG